MTQCSCLSLSFYLRVSSLFGSISTEGNVISEDSLAGIDSEWS